MCLTLLQKKTKLKLIPTLLFFPKQTVVDLDLMKQ